MTKKDITDTSRLPIETNFAIAAAAAVPMQEAAGQRELVESTQLPVDGLLGSDRPRWEALGVKILDEGKSDDPLFCRVELPAGWRKVPTDHPLWTDLVDGGGKVRAKIVYKAAFYDRYARVSLEDDLAASEAPDCVCADCGHEQASMDPCGRCRSVRVVLVTVIRDLFGENWRDAFDVPVAPKEAP